MCQPSGHAPELGTLELLAQLTPSLAQRAISAQVMKTLGGRGQHTAAPLICGSAHVSPGQLRGSQARRDLQTVLAPGAEERAEVPAGSGSGAPG